MKPIVSIIMGSTSDLPILKKAADFLNEMQVPFEMNALSAHRTPREVEEFATGAQARGIKVIIAAAGMAAALPGSDCRHDSAACDRYTHQLDSQRYGRPLFNCADASGHIGGYRWH